MNHEGHGASGLNIPLSELHCVCGAEELEKRLGALPHVSKATVDFQHDLLRINYRASTGSEADIRRAVNESARCACEEAEPEGRPSRATVHVD
jgi:hypothetical protein